MEEIDPAYARWRKHHPKFHLAEWVSMLAHARGSVLDAICADLRSHAPSHARAMVVACEAEPIARTKALLLAALAEAALPEALDLFRRCLSSDDASLRHWAATGLQKLGKAAAT
jgi:glycosyltransferase involved in cell wall biosynthesis